MLKTSVNVCNYLQLHTRSLNLQHDVCRHSQTWIARIQGLSGCTIYTCTCMYAIHYRCTWTVSAVCPSITPQRCLCSYDNNQHYLVLNKIYQLLNGIVKLQPNSKSSGGHSQEDVSIMYMYMYNYTCLCIVHPRILPCCQFVIKYYDS